MKKFVKIGAALLGVGAMSIGAASSAIAGMHHYNNEYQNSSYNNYYNNEGYHHYTGSGAYTGHKNCMAYGLDNAGVLKTVSSYVPDDATVVSSYCNGYKYKVVCASATGVEKYEIGINCADNTMYDYEYERNDSNGSFKVVKTEEQVKNIVLSELPKAQIVGVKLDSDDYLKDYEVYFINNGYNGSYEINPETGVIQKRDFELIPAAYINTPQTGTNNSYTPQQNTASSNPTLISTDKAKEIALSKVPGAAIIKLKLDLDDGRYKYEGEMRKGFLKYEFEIDAVTGSIIDWDIDD